MTWLLPSLRTSSFVSGMQDIFNEHKCQWRSFQGIIKIEFWRIKHILHLNISVLDKILSYFNVIFKHQTMRDKNTVISRIDIIPLTLSGHEDILMVDKFLEVFITGSGDRCTSSKLQALFRLSDFSALALILKQELKFLNAFLISRATKTCSIP